MKNIRKIVTTCILFLETRILISNSSFLETLQNPFTRQNSTVIHPFNKMYIVDLLYVYS